MTENNRNAKTNRDHKLILNIAYSKILCKISINYFYTFLSHLRNIII